MIMDDDEIERIYERAQQADRHWADGPNTMLRIGVAVLAIGAILGAALATLLHLT